MKIQTIVPRMILDSRGYPTVEADIILSDGSFGRASVPSGASTGSHEALELRDGDTHFGGMGVEKAIENIRSMTGSLTSLEFENQTVFDSHLLELDGTKNKTKMGANALLALSLAFAKAVSQSKNIELYEYIRSEYEWSKELSLPMPLVNVLNGGQHATHSTDVQEWMIVPVGAHSFKEAIEMGTSVFYSLRKMLKEKGTSAVGDEGGFPLSNVSSNEEALVLLSEAVQKAGLSLGSDIAFALDVAASEFFVDGQYILTRDSKKLDSIEMIAWLQDIAARYPIVSIEDGLAEDDWDNWQKLTSEMSTKQIVGDDLFVTNTEYIQKGIDLQAGNAVLIKLNQIGTLSETAAAISLAQAHGMNTIISHRSGETEDTTIAHLAVASGSGQIKTGSFSRTERLAKYNELLRISEKIHTFKNPFA